MRVKITIETTDIHECEDDSEIYVTEVTSRESSSFEGALENCIRSHIRCLPSTVWEIAADLLTTDDIDDPYDGPNEQSIENCRLAMVEAAEAFRKSVTDFYATNSK